MLEFPSPQAVKAMSKTKGFLAVDLHIVITTQTNDFGPIAQALDAHLRYWEESKERVVLIGAGPLLPELETDPEFQGGGLIILRAASIEEATEIVEA